MSCATCVHTAMRLLCGCCVDDMATVHPKPARNSLPGEAEALLAPGLQPFEEARSSAYSERNSDAVEQQLYVMRHGHREDEESDTWHVDAARPWDPPLSAKGREQAKLAGQDFVGKVDFVLTSPFQRCLQTSAEIVKALNLPQGRWLVNWPMCECADPRLLFAGREELVPFYSDKPIQAWMWEGQTLHQAIDAFWEAERNASGVEIKPELWNAQAPDFPETLPRALKRYEKGIKALQKDFEGKRVLMVSHGEALRAAVNMHEKRANVYEVKHTGYIPMARSRPHAGARWGAWQMTCANEETGVLWFMD